ncbi:MAG TPA: TrbI/VirB10 family protein [Vicinamibacterales bacterium]|jgi:hypothetical protein|nr:TrbI/VirB10 family protein [Vicinamibacterales bacterium]
MISRPLVLGLVAAACVAAAGAGAFVAVRQNSADRAEAAVTTPASAQPGAAQAAPAQPVSETEALVTQPTPSDSAKSAEAPATATRPAEDEKPTVKADTRVKPTAAERPAPKPQPSRTPSTRAAEPPVYHPNPPAPAPTKETQPSAQPVVEAPLPEAGRAPEIVPAPPEPRFVEVVVPSASVIGLQMNTSVTSETARVEDRVEARVTRDVMAGGHTAIPAGSRMLGSVTMVERGGKIKEQAKLGVRFHTLVLANGTEVPLRTDVIVREGESPSGDSARKIGGAAVGGAILGAILGGGKGAVVGGATGAAGGTAVVMAGDRNAAKLTTGTIVTVKLNAPVTLEVERN